MHKTESSLSSLHRVSSWAIGARGRARTRSGSVEEISAEDFHRSNAANGGTGQISVYRSSSANEVTGRAPIHRSNSANEMTGPTPVATMQSSVNENASVMTNDTTDSKQSHLPPASGHNIEAPVFGSTTHSQKAENLKRAAELRAKMLAQRQRAAAHHLREAELNANGAFAGKQTNAAMETGNQKEIETGNDPFSVESLLTEGKNPAATEGPDKNLTSTARPSVGPDQAIPSNLANDHHPQGAVSASKQSVDRTKNDYALQTQAENPDPPTDLTHAYYTDLPLWLEITGYHDIDYRNSQLANIKERKRLEQDAARIAERLAKLNQDAEANISFKRPGPAVQPSCETQRPPLPAMMPSATAATAVGNIKRAHSPVELLPSKKMSIRPKMGEHPDIPRYDTPTGDLTRRITFPEPRCGPSHGRLQAAENRRGHERDGRAPSPAGHPRRARLHGGQNVREYERDGGDPSVAPWVRHGRLLNIENRRPENRAPPIWRDHDVYMPPRGHGPPNGDENRPDIRYSNVNVGYDGGPTGPRRGRLPRRLDERK